MRLGFGGLTSIIGVFVLLFGLMSIVLALLFDPDAFRDRLATKVAAATGCRLAAAGEVELKLLPWPVVELRQVVFSSPEQREEAGVRAEHLRVRGVVGALFRGRIRLEDMELVGVSSNDGTEVGRVPAMRCRDVGTWDRRPNDGGDRDER